MNSPLGLRRGYFILDLSGWLTMDNLHQWSKNIGTSAGVAFGCRSGGQLATTLVNHYFYNSFHFHFLSKKNLTFRDSVIKDID